MDSSKATAKHIRQVPGDLLAAQMQLMQHQCTQLPAGNYPRRKQNSTTRWKPQNHKIPEIPTSQKPSDMLKLDACSNKCTRCGDTLHAKGFQCPARKFQCKICHKFGHFTTVCYQKSQGQHSSNSFQSRKPKAQQLHVGVLYTHHDADRSESESEMEDTFCFQMKIHRTQISHPEVPKLIYLMANLAYCLQDHHKRNQYLQARLDTCTDMNLMPMVGYCLMFKDPGLKKLTPSNMEIETYTTEVVKIIGMCYFYLVHPKSKQLMKVLFFVAKENRSILLSCRTTMELGLIRPHTCLDYLPPKARLLTSTCDQPTKTKIHKPNIHYTKEKPIKMVTPKKDKFSTPQSQQTKILDDTQLITRKEQIMARFPDVFKGIGKFPGEPYKLQLDPKFHPNTLPADLFQYTLKKPSKLKLIKC